ncbi:hypothetical protein TNIN_447131 [Trichonephila inaurata madagascariensis]|uniref:Uncharacterized protein n=1 Tax=Trichonephila inaurata madagascariensis TaxID=2747483 RepID=A0A8X6YRE8_9ARAC|nr:hypothetical protein TNIN_447131 [Trichonephila inaurata madagascariensis]
MYQRAIGDWTRKNNKQASRTPSVSLDGVMIWNRDVTPDKTSFKVTEYDSLSSCLRFLCTALGQGAINFNSKMGMLRMRTHAQRLRLTGLFL